MAVDPALLAKAEEIRDESNVGANTAARVGGLSVDIVEALGDNDDSWRNLSQYIEDYMAKLGADGILDWKNSPVVFLVSMGADLDGDGGAVISDGDLYYYNQGGYQIREKQGGGGQNNYAAKENVLYINNYTGNMYRWDGADMVQIGGNSLFRVVDIVGADLEIADENGNILLRLANGHVETKYFDSSDIPMPDLTNYYTKSQTYNKTEVDALIKEIDPSTPVTPPNNLKILFLGNSFTVDSISYLPFILKNYGINVTIGITYYGGASINDYNTKYSSNAVQEYYLIDTSTDANWTKQTVNTPTPQNAVKAKQWDMIVLQQANSHSYDISEYSNVGSLVAKILADATNENVRIGWNINHIATDYFVGGTDNRQGVLDCCKEVCEDPDNHISFVFPYGTAIFNIQDNYPTMGDVGYMTYTLGHLQEGLPCYAAAIANAQALFEAFYPKCSAVGDVFTPDTVHTIQAHGDPVGLTDWLKNSRVAQFAALSANRDKFNINFVSFI